MNDIKDVIEQFAKIPNLSDFKNPLFIGPHPDDIEFGCGALIYDMVKKGATPHFLIVTDGAAGTDDPAYSPSKLRDKRKEEAMVASEFLGAKSCDFLELEDGGIYLSEDVTRLIAPYVLKYLPDVIFTCDPNLRSECHSDHIKTGEGVRAVTQIIGYPEALRRHNIKIDGFKVFPRNITLVYYFTDDPNHFEPVSKEGLNAKTKALLFHESQMVSDEMKMLVHYFSLKAEMDGAKIQVPLAESYQVIVPVCQHVYSQGLHY